MHYADHSQRQPEYSETVIRMNSGFLIENVFPIQPKYRQWRRNEFESGGTSGAGKCFGHVLHFFVSTSTVQLVVLVSTFVMVSTI